MIDFVEFAPKVLKNRHNNVNKCIVYPGKIPCVAKINKHNESSIYHFVQDIPLKEVLPNYFGTWSVGSDEYIILEDLLAGYTQANFVDIKLGIRMHDIRTKRRSVEKLSQTASQTTSGSYGFRITDFTQNFYQPLTTMSYSSDGKPNIKDFNVYQVTSIPGIETSLTEVNKFFHTFFSRTQIYQFFQELKHIREVFIHTQHQFPGFRLYSSSVFVCFDSFQPDCPVRVKLIDIAHAHFDVGLDGGNKDLIQFDDGVIRGLDSLILLTGQFLS